MASMASLLQNSTASGREAEAADVAVGRAIGGREKWVLPSHNYFFFRRGAHGDVIFHYFFFAKHFGIDNFPSQLANMVGFRLQQLEKCQVQ